MIVSVRKWTQKAMPLRIVAEREPKAPRAVSHHRRLGFLATWQKMLEAQADLVIKPYRD